MTYLPRITAATALALALLSGACTDADAPPASVHLDGAGDAEIGEVSTLPDGGIRDELVAQIDGSTADGALPSTPDPEPRAAGTLCAPTAAKIDVNTLLGEMTDLGLLARRSPIHFTTREASSYDRRSVTPAPASDTPEGWYANTDWGNFVRVEQTARGAEHVMLDAEGPGSIVRIWTANGQEGTLRIYLDDMATPAITADFVALLSGQVAPFTAPFSVVNSSGRNFDFPLPYRHRAKVTVTGSAKIPATAYFYQVFYRQYAPCADVETFRQDGIASAALQAAKAALTMPISSNVTELSTTDAILDSGNPTLVLAAAAGGSEITELVIQPSALDTATLRQTTLALSFDGDATTLVPLGDFFGAGPGLLAHRTLPLEARDDGTLISRFVMPFANEAKITLGLSGSRTAVVTIKHHARRFDAGTYHFFAHWTARGPIPSRPFRDLLLADVGGEGAFVGTMLSHDDLSPEWWGEGDEKISVDDEAFPSLFGTGTEDYFGYAYSTRDPFDHAFRMLRPTGPNRGQLTNARFHVLDVIRFDTALRFELEEWHWDPAASVFFDTLVYFYGRPGTLDKMAPPAPGDFRLPSHP
jgi:hypothetical protein